MTLLVSLVNLMSNMFQEGRTPLHFAAAGGHFEVVNWLIKAIGVNVEKRDKVGTTEL